MYISIMSDIHEECDQYALDKERGKCLYCQIMIRVSNTRN